MRGDEAQLAEGGDDALDRFGPRHAAPRKSLLTKLQIPASRAIALAAMPTAVFVGMGLTPKLALADDKADIPFAPGPCVTRSDEPQESASPSPSESAKPTPKPSESAEPKPSATPSGEADKPADADADEDTADAEKKTDAQDEAAAEPSPSKTTNPLDPLGVGDALNDLFTPGDKESEEPSPSPSASDEKDDTAEKSGATDEESGVGEKAGTAADKLKDDIKGAADQAGATVEELDERAKKAKEEVEGTTGADGKERFPCPTADPEALAAADLEEGIPLLPDDPWELETTKLTLKGLDYHGIVEVKTYSGKVKKVLKFTAKETDIKDLHQLVVGPNGTTSHVKAAEGSTSTIRDGEVTMYTEELKGNLFGLIPVTFSPETPPPLNVPFAFFTDVKVTQAGQFGGTLTVPGLQNYFTGG